MLNYTYIVFDINERHKCQLGIQELFSPTANLVNIGSSPEGPLLVSSVIQKTGIEVNEKGSVAHASTGCPFI